MNQCFKTAIIGCGSISHTHVAALSKLGCAEITALCDVDGTRLDALAEKAPHAARYMDYRELLQKADADIIHICTPHYLHAEMAIDAMRAGRDVYLEKPCAMNRAEAERIIASSDETGKKVCVSFQNRVVNTTVEAKKIADRNALGALTGGKGIVTWHREGAYYTESGWRGRFATEGGGVLMNQSIHTLDLLYYFLGPARQVTGCAVQNMNGDITEVEDTAEAFIRFDGGRTAIFYATNCNRTDAPIELELYFEKGSLLIRNDALYLCDADGMRKICQNETAISGKSYWGNGHVRMIKSFYDALDGTESDYPYCDIRDAVPVLDIIDGIYRHSPVHPPQL